MKNLNPLDTNPCLNSAFNFTPDDISGDVERLITKTILPYVDPTHPFLQQDELQAECRFKLARIISDGRLVDVRRGSRRLRSSRLPSKTTCAASSKSTHLLQNGAV
jgi:hypothetical protein